MGMGVLRVIGIVLGLGAVILTLWSMGSPKWSVSVPQTQAGQPITFEAYRGLWKQCYGSGQSGFNTQCNKYTQTITQLAKYGLVGQRALMVIATIFAFVGLISGVTSSDAVNLAATSGSKSKAAGGAAGMFIVSGLCNLAACSWAASKVIKNNDFQFGAGGSMGTNKGIVMTLGVGIYTGWCAAALCLIIGVMFGMTCCSGSDDEEDDYDNYNQGQQYQASVAGSSMPGKQFV